MFVCVGGWVFCGHSLIIVSFDCWLDHHRFPRNDLQAHHLLTNSALSILCVSIGPPSLKLLWLLAIWQTSLVIFLVISLGVISTCEHVCVSLGRSHLHVHICAGVNNYPFWWIPLAEGECLLPPNHCWFFCSLCVHFLYVTHLCWHGVSSWPLPDIAVPYSHSLCDSC